MSNNPTIRRSQAIHTFGPGALIDLPEDSAIIGGLNSWIFDPDCKEEVHEPRLRIKLQEMTGVPNPQLFSPPRDESPPWEKGSAQISAWKFPKWCVVQEEETEEIDGVERKRRKLVQRRQLDEGKRLAYEKKPVVPIRFVKACSKGHVTDIDWEFFVHDGATNDCKKPLFLEESGTGGDLISLRVICGCGAQRRLSDAMETAARPLGICFGEKPWLGPAHREECGEPGRMLIRTASNAYFPQVMRVLSLPEVRSEVEVVVQELWNILSNAEVTAHLDAYRMIPHVAPRLERFSNDEVLSAIESIRSGGDAARPVKVVELEALILAQEGDSEDHVAEKDFFAERLPDDLWRKGDHCNGIEAIIQLHRLREVSAITGFTRFEPLVTNLLGEFESDVQVASLDDEPSWFPAVENRGEGIFVLLSSSEVKSWLRNQQVKKRLDMLEAGHRAWTVDRDLKHPPDFHGGAYVLLHTLSHLLLQSVSLTCGYPASSIRERIYCLEDQFGILLYTGSPDTDGTLGGLVQQARHFSDHLLRALRMAALCSNDPICSFHDPDDALEDRRLHGAACHGCTFVSETSCENRNEYLDRALVVPVLGTEEAAFFQVKTT